ncbi:MAG: DUF1634 domain-containing protein [Planctomycetota bacterium]
MTATNITISAKGSAPQRTRGEGAVGRFITLGGVFGALLLMIVALAKSIDSTTEDAPYVFHVDTFIQGVVDGRPDALAAAGCVLLVMTPLFRIIWITIMLTASKRGRFAAAAACVLAILVAAMFAGSWN